MRRFAKFLVVGTMNTAIDWGILNILLMTSRTETVLGFAICKIIGFTVAMTNSYILNKKLVFQDNQKVSAKQASVFVMVNLIGLAINVSIAVAVLTACRGFLVPGQWQFLICSNLGAAIATIASLLWNFWGYRRLVFK